MVPLPWYRRTPRRAVAGPRPRSQWPLSAWLLPVPGAAFPGHCSSLLAQVAPSPCKAVNTDPVEPAPSLLPVTASPIPLTWGQGSAPENTGQTGWYGMVLLVSENPRVSQQGCPGFGVGDTLVYIESNHPSTQVVHFPDLTWVLGAQGKGSLLGGAACPFAQASSECVHQRPRSAKAWETGNRSTGPRNCCRGHVPSLCNLRCQGQVSCLVPASCQAESPC